MITPAVVVLIVTAVLIETWLAVRRVRRENARVARLHAERAARATEDIYWDRYRLDALRAAMQITVNRFEPMVRRLIDERDRVVVEVVEVPTLDVQVPALEVVS